MYPCHKSMTSTQMVKIGTIVEHTREMNKRSKSGPERQTCIVIGEIRVQCLWSSRIVNVANLLTGFQPSTCLLNNVRHEPVTVIDV